MEEERKKARNKERMNERTRQMNTNEKINIQKYKKKAHFKE